MALKNGGFIAVAFLLISAVCFIPSFAAPEWEPASFLTFADHLYSEGDFLRAAGEYERYLALTESHPGAGQDSILLRISFCYTRAGAFSRALNSLERLRLSSDSAMAEEAWLDIAFVRFRMEDYPQSIHVLRNERKQNSSVADSSPGGTRPKLMLALDYMQLREWNQSRQILETISGSGTLSPYYLQLRSADSAGLKLPSKNPWLAGTLSAVIPGSGKMYAGRVKDGFFSLALVGLTGALAGYGFYHGGIKSVEGWVLGSLALGFYGGNIYGSVLVAHQANLADEQRILKGLSFSAHASLPF